MNRLPTQATHDRNILALVLGLGSLLFVIDLFMPLGVAIGVLYAGIVLLAAASSNSRLPFFTAVASTLSSLRGGTRSAGP